MIVMRAKDPAEQLHAFVLERLPYREAPGTLGADHLPGSKPASSDTAWVSRARWEV